MPRPPSPAHLLAAAALLVPALGFLAPLGMAPLLAAVGIALAALHGRALVPELRPLWPVAALLLALALWGALSAIWSIAPGQSLFEAARLVPLSAGGIAAIAAARGLDEPGRHLVRRAMLAGLGLGLVVVAIEYFGNFPLRRLLSGDPGRIILLPSLDRGAVVLALAVWPGFLALAEMRRAAAAWLGLGAVLGILTRLISLAAVLAAVGGGVAAALAWRRPRAVAGLLVAGFLAAAVLLPAATPGQNGVTWLIEHAPWLRTSAQHRLIMWRFSADRIAERPLLGWGMDAARSMPGRNTAVADYMRLPPGFLLIGTVMQLHPHNGLVQLWLELGAPGAALGVMLYAFIARAAARTADLTQAGRAAALGLLAAATFPFLLSFGVWQAWWNSLLWLVAALLLACASRSAPSRA